MSTCSGNKPLLWLGRKKIISKAKAGKTSLTSSSNRGMLSFTGEGGGRGGNEEHSSHSPPQSSVFNQPFPRPSVHARKAKIDNEECQPRNRKSPLPRPSCSRGLECIPRQLGVIYYYQKKKKRKEKTSLPKRHPATQLVNANWLWLVMSNDIPLSQ